jgi:hypothetical protein
MKKSGLEKEIHSARNHISVLKMYLSGLEEMKTLTDKGEFANSHKERCGKAVRGLEETCERILKEHGKGK